MLNCSTLGHRPGILLKLKGRVYCARVRPVLLYDCKTWNLRVGNVLHLEIFYHFCLHCIAEIGWIKRVVNVDVRNLALGAISDNTISAYETS